MKIKDLKILSEYLGRGSFVGTNRIGPIFWNELILEKIINNRLNLSVKESSMGAGQKIDVCFEKEAYNKLNEKQKKLSTKSLTRISAKQ